MEIPNELKAPAPRDPFHAGPFLKKGKTRARQIMIGGIGVMLVMPVLMWLALGATGTLAIGLSAGVGGLITLMGAAQMFVQLRAKNLYVLGHATIAKVTLVQINGDGAGAAYTRIDVELMDGRGRATGSTMVMGREAEVDVAVGDSMVALTHGEVFGVYSPRLGMTLGRLKR